MSRLVTGGVWKVVVMVSGLVVGGVGCSVALAEDLATAVRLTLTHHPAIPGKQAEVEAKGFEGDTARAQRYPSLSTQAAVQDGSSPVTLRARQPLWAFGRIDSGIEYADIDLLVEQADLQRVQRDLIRQTAVAYARVLGVQQQIAVARENIQSLEEFFRKIQRRELAQLASQADVRLAFSRLTQAKAQLQRYEGELRVAQTELDALTQREVAVETPVADTLTQLPGVAELERLAQQNSAEIALKKQEVELAEADIDREKKSAMPTVYLQADHIINDEAERRKQTNVGIVFEGNLDGMGFAALNRSKAAGSRLNASLADLKASETEVRREVNNLFANREQQYSLIRSQQTNVSQLMKIMDSYQRQYEAGHKSWLEVLNMQRELSQQRQQYVQARNEWLIFTLRLAALTGRLDKLASVETADQPKTDMKKQETDARE